MSENQATAPTDLEAAIEQNPEAVAEFVEHLDAVNELLDVLSLGESALDDEMVRELSATGSTLAESADGLATDETVALAETVGENGDDLREALDTLLALQQSGTLDDLAELAEVGSLATAALDDEMVTSWPVPVLRSARSRRRPLTTILVMASKRCWRVSVRRSRAPPSRSGPLVCFADYVIRMFSTGWAICWRLQARSAVRNPRRSHTNRSLRGGPLSRSM